MVLLPIALGASAVATYLGAGHDFIFIAGGGFMIVLGMLSFLGRSPFPRIHLPVNLGRSDTPSVFTLGAFSGVASSCCAPVLAGVVVLTALSTSMLQALFVGLAYVSGMIFPLFMSAVALDRKGLRASKFWQGRMVHIKLFSAGVDIHSSKLIAGLMFVAMGVITVILGFTNTMLTAPGSQLFGIYQTAIERAIANVISSSEASAIGLVALLLILGVLARSYARRHKTRGMVTNQNSAL